MWKLSCAHPEHAPDLTSDGTVVDGVTGRGGWRRAAVLAPIQAEGELPARNGIGRGLLIGPRLIRYFDDTRDDQVGESPRARRRTTAIARRCPTAVPRSCAEQRRKAFRGPRSPRTHPLTQRQTVRPRSTSNFRARRTKGPFAKHCATACRTPCESTLWRL
jgi:hypothetical protein